MVRAVLLHTSGSTALCGAGVGGNGWIVPPPLYKEVFFPKVDLPLAPKAPLLLQAPFLPDLSPWPIKLVDSLGIACEVLDLHFHQEKFDSPH